ncbi:MAG: PTS transporter subunit EIIB, partial [Eggerthellaceae bacterium]|nr:PTS transporter subunit EIIB [Eggerthellaceae bacterium]
MALDYVKLSNEIIEKTGGAANIKSSSYCMTRLRLVLANEGKVNDADVEAIKGVKGVIKQGGQYQIVIGPEVSNLHKEFQKHIKVTDEGEAEGDSKAKGNILQRLVGFISGCMLPLLPAMLGAGMLKVILVIANIFFGVPATDPTYSIFFAVSDAFFYFLPV